MADCPGYDSDDTNAPPGSKPILVASGAARATRTISVVHFHLTVATDLSSYNAEATKAGLAALYGVHIDAISLTVEAGSLLLAVTIKSADASEASLALLIDAVNSTSASLLTAAVGSDAAVQQVQATTVQEEYEAACPRGHWWVLPL